MCGQLVLCHGINDGDELIYSMNELFKYFPYMTSVSVVPAGMTKFRDKLYPLTDFSKEAAEKVIDTVNSYGDILKSKVGTRMFYVADEFYLKADRKIPDSDYYEDYPQLENGVGMLRSFSDEFDIGAEDIAFLSKKAKKRRVSVATGVASYPMMVSLANRISSLTDKIKIDVYEIKNFFFGESITVSGLLTGKDIYEQSKDKRLGDTLILPANCLRDGEDVFLCGMTLDELAENQFPAGVSYQIGYDPTEYIRITMIEIFETLILTLVLVVAITYLFLQDWRATLVPTLTIPVSLIGTFIFLIPLGFSINLLTMFGLILVIGSLVDDAIVVTENCMRIIEEEGLSPKEAALKSMKQITGAVIATTLVIVAIYVPVGFYGGMVGTIYLQFSVTMCISLCLSTVNALTLSPALCALLLRKPKANKVFWLFNKALNGSCSGYMKISRFMVRYTIVALVIFAGVIYMNYHYLTSIPSSFIPSEDKGALMGMVELRPGATLAETNAVLKQVEDEIESVPGVKNCISIYGYSFVSGAGENTGMFIVTLKDWVERQTPETQINAIQMNLQQLVAKIPEARINFFQPPAIMGLGVTGGVTFMLQANAGQTPDELYQAMNKILMRLNTQYKDRVLMAFGSFETGTPELFIDIDREKAEALGVPVNQVFAVLSGNIASDYVNDFNLMGYSFKVKMQAEESERADANELLQLMVQSKRGAMVPLSSFATLRRTAGSRSLTRFNQLMSAKITVQGKPGVSSHVLMRDIENIMKEDFPRGYQVSWTDMSYQERGNEGRIIQLLVLALIFGYLFLVGQYESWTIPISVVLSFFFAMLGGFIGMKCTGLDFSIYAQLGIVMLIGLACKNAILMVEFSKQERESGKSVEEAAQNGFSHRYRAVLMTAWSFVIGVFPMVIATGAGAGSRRAIGITTFYGMLLSTIIGIVFIPSLYAFFQRSRERVYGWFDRKKNSGE